MYTQIFTGYIYNLICLAIMAYSDEQNISIGMIESTLMGHWKRATWQEEMACKPSVIIYAHIHDKTYFARNVWQEWSLH